MCPIRRAGEGEHLDVNGWVGGWMGRIQLHNGRLSANIRTKEMGVRRSNNGPRRKGCTMSAGKPTG